MSQSTINNLVLRIKSQSRPTGEKLLYSRLLTSDSIKRVINQVIEEVNPTDAIRAESIALDLGTISLAQFETEFTPRLVQALTEYLFQLSGEPGSGIGSDFTAESAAQLTQPRPDPAAPLAQRRPEPAAQLTQRRPDPAVPLAQRRPDPAAPLAQFRPDSASLFPLAILCLQPAALQQLLVSQRPEQLLLLLKTLLNQRQKHQAALPRRSTSRVTASRLAFAALGFLFDDREGLNWLRDNAPSLSQLETWQAAIASGEIAVEQVLDLLTGHDSLSESITIRWLRPLWQQKTVRGVIRSHAGTEAVQEIDARLSPHQASNERQHAAAVSALRVNNAGLALLWPLLPQLFAHSELCQEGQFPDDTFRWRGVQSLHYLAWGGEGPGAESCPLNQLLCGIAPDATMPDLAPLNEQQQQCIDDWLSAVGQQLAGWEKFSLTDIRQLFLQRPGEIFPDTEPPQIAVQPEAFDYLLGNLPWPLILVSLPWLKQPLTLIWPLPHITG